MFQIKIKKKKEFDNSYILKFIMNLFVNGTIHSTILRKIRCGIVMGNINIKLYMCVCVYIYIYIYIERERERERERGWVQVTLCVTLSNVTPLNIF